MQKTTQVTSAQQATEIAMDFLRKYYSFARPISAKKADAKWITKSDIGAFTTQIATLEIDANTGEIILFDTPEGA